MMQMPEKFPFSRMRIVWFLFTTLMTISVPHLSLISPFIKPILSSVIKQNVQLDTLSITYEQSRFVSKPLMTR